MGVRAGDRQGRPSGPPWAVEHSRMRGVAMHEVSDKDSEGGIRQGRGGCQGGVPEYEQAQRSVHTGRMGQPGAGCRALEGSGGHPCRGRPGAGRGSSRRVRRRDGPAKKTELRLG